MFTNNASLKKHFGSASTEPHYEPAYEEPTKPLSILPVEKQQDVEVTPLPKKNVMSRLQIVALIDDLAGKTDEPDSGRDFDIHNRDVFFENVARLIVLIEML